MKRKWLWAIFVLLAVSCIGTAQNMVDVEVSGSWVSIYNAKGTKIKTVSAASVGEVLGFSDQIIVCRRGSWIYTYDENFKQIASVSASSMGTLKCVTGKYVVFVNGSWVKTYDEKLKLVSTRSKM